jgi:hypothetical protein
MRAQQRTTLLAVIAASAAAFVAAPAVAQSPATSPTQSSEKTVHLTMEQRHIVKEIIVKEMKVAPPSASVPTAIGAVVPAGIALQPVPVEVSAKIPQIRTHSFVVKDESVVIVDPKDNRVAALVD